MLHESHQAKKKNINEYANLRTERTMATNNTGIGFCIPHTCTLPCGSRGVSNKKFYSDVRCCYHDRER